MKKRNLLLIITLLFISSPLNVYALTGSVSLSCNNKTLKQGETTTCTITGNVADGNISSLELNVDLSSNLILEETFTDSNWQGNGDKGRYLLYGPIISNGNFNIGTFKVKAKENIYGTDEKITLKNVIYYDDVEYKDTNISNATHSIRIPSNICTLSSIKISNVDLSFSSEKLTYDLNTTEQSITISATKTNEKSKISGDIGTKNLVHGKNTFNIVVTAEDGTKKTYVINVTKPDDRSTNNNLSNLNLSSGKINFDKNITSYNLEVDPNIDKISIEASLEDSKASFVKGYEPRTVNLNYGENTILIKTKSEKEIEKTYTIKVIRKDDRSNNNNLSNITLNHGNLHFDKNKTEYRVSVENEIENIIVTALAEDSKSKVEFPSNVKLQLGSNEIKIKVTAESGSVKEYKIVVIRKEKNYILDSNNYLKELNITGYNINFNKDKLTYDIIINDESELKLNYITESDKATVSCTGNESLEDGSAIKISIYAEDGSVREYIINISKNNQEQPILLYIIVGTFIIGLLVLICNIYYKNHKKSYEL